MAGMVFYKRVQDLVQSLDSRVASLVTALNSGIKLGRSGHTITCVTYKVTVATAGTRVALTPSDPSLVIFRVDISANFGNAGFCYIGGNTISKTTMRQGALASNESYCIEAPSGSVLDLSSIYVDADTNGNSILINAFAVSE